MSQSPTPSASTNLTGTTGAPPPRLITATSLFDGHDASINIMRRIFQSKGAEIIHLGHNRSVHEILTAALQEDADGVAITSYQGGHLEFFKYLHDQLKERARRPVRIYGGGGGVILPDEIEELHRYGIARIYSPEDGRRLGLEGMIEDVLADLKKNPGPTSSSEEPPAELKGLATDHPRLARIITQLETGELPGQAPAGDPTGPKRAPVLGITGTGGAGKSSLIDEFIRRFLSVFPEKNIALLAVDPTKSRTGGALLGDRLRMNSVYSDRVFVRSLATRQEGRPVSSTLPEITGLCAGAGFDLVLIETSGIGQSNSEIRELADLSLYVMTPEYGAPSQLEKIDMLDYADFVALNKSDKPSADDALHQVRKQYQRGRQLFDLDPTTLPVFGTICSRFNDHGMNQLFSAIAGRLERDFPERFSAATRLDFPSVELPDIIPARRQRYLADIADTIRDDKEETHRQAKLAGQWQSLQESASLLENEPAGAGPETLELLKDRARELSDKLDPEVRRQLEAWSEVKEQYGGDTLTYKVRDKEIKQPLRRRSLSGLPVPRVSLPRTDSWSDLTRFFREENLPGNYPFTAGLFPLKREGEDPTRMFAGEGGPERTNKRFHYLAQGQPASRLSTAFDSVTLYGEDPARRPDVFGKIGNSGVSICTVDDMKRLYSGFDLTDPTTSVSMTINGPAPMILAFFMRTAIDQNCEKELRRQGRADEVRQKIEQSYHDRGLPLPEYRADRPESNEGLGLLLLGSRGRDWLEPEVYAKIKKETLGTVRGTVQADILKEDQAQNTCIFSTQFALKMMGDIQEYFTANQVRNFYSVSVSGYHMAEAGANPVTQLAFTLANGFTFVEYYLSRGLDIDSFAPNLSFFFSNGMDPEYSVIGRVARRIWARAMKLKYKAGRRSQVLKYHIQTSGRSLHAREIDFNDIRTTLQALYAIYDNCNSLHTNAYDEAVTTPTEESVRRALAIQLIINRELGLAKNENPLQGSYIIEELTDLVEEAVLSEFHRLADRGGVLGAMENIYQRNKIQEESMLYEGLKMSGEYPIIGVNTFLAKSQAEEGAASQVKEVIRSDDAEKTAQIEGLEAFHRFHQPEFDHQNTEFKRRILEGGNSFELMMDFSQVASLGQISHALYETGGQYRRNL